MAQKAVRYGIALVVGLALGALLDFAVLNYQYHESCRVAEVFPTEIVSPAEEGETPYLNMENTLDYVFEGGADVQNIFIQFDAEQKQTLRKTTIDIYLQDEGNGKYYYVSTVLLRNGNQWLRIHPMGKLTKLRLKATRIGNYDQLAEVNYDQEAIDNAVHDANVKIQTSFNVPTTYKTHWLFIGATAAVVLLIYLFRPSSSIYTRRYNENKWFPILITLGVVLVVSAAAGVRYNPDFASTVNQRQYYELAEAFVHGQTYVLTEPSADLQAMDNPYDYRTREAEKVAHSWDHAYYNGHYYVYFGVLPCLLLFLPYYLFTGGGELNMAIAIVIVSVFAAWGLMKLLLSICKRWFPLCSEGLFLVLAFTLVGGSWLQYAAMRPTHYALPILMGIALLAWGLALWVDATAQERISKGRAVGGSILLALIITARPQLLAGGLLVFVLLALHARKWGGREALRAIAACAVPVLAVFGAQGWYNYIRFDSPFDFGANYNITYNDMTKRGWELDRTPLALVAYLVQPPSLGASAPFLRGTDLDVGYNGVMITEKMLGGIFWLTPLLLAAFLPLFKRFRSNVSREKGTLIVVSILLALIIVVFDAQVAGVLQRYFMDFGVFLAFAAVLAMGSIWGAPSSVLLEGESIVQAESILDTRALKPAFTSAGMFLVLLVAGTVLPVYLVVFGL